MRLEKCGLLYSGKAKSLYETNDPRYLIMSFRDDTSAFDGDKLAQLKRKGLVNQHFSAFVMDVLAHAGIETQFVESFSETEAVVKRLEMIPVECVMRNFAAGHLCSRLGIEEGRQLSPPTFELFLKNDPLHDPMINESLAETFGWATPEELSQMRSLTYQINAVLVELFARSDLLLVDFKLEFGRFEGRIVLGDEFTPDGCRIWDAVTLKKLDKDRFRRDLGGVVEAYEEAAARLGIALPAN